MRFEQSVQRNRRAGFTLIEVVVALAIIAVLSVAAIPSIQGMIERRRLQGFARDLGNVFQIARSQAIRTGNNQIVFFGPLGTADPAGTVGRRISRHRELPYRCFGESRDDPATESSHIRGVGGDR